MKQKGIYILTFPNGKQYVGKSVDIGNRLRRHFSLIDDHMAVSHAIKKYGKASIDVEIIEYQGISPKALNAVEKWKIAELGAKQHGYNETHGGDGWDSETAKENNRKKVANGTHNFLGGEIQRKSNLKRVANGTHPFVGGELNRKRLEEGTHNFLGPEFQRNVNLKRVANGTHNFLDPEFRRRQSERTRDRNRKRWKQYREKKHEAGFILAYAFYHTRLYFNIINKRKNWSEILDLTESEQLTFLL